MRPFARMRMVVWAALVAVLVCAAQVRAQGVVGAESQDDFVGPPTVQELMKRFAQPADPTGIDTSKLANQQRGLANLSEMNPIAVMAGASELIDRPEGGTRGGADGRQGLSGPINVMLLLTVITLVPSIMLMTTCFVRIVVVLGLLKQAIGTQTLPPPQVVVGLAMFMTLVVMSPTIDRINREAIVPYNQGHVKDYDELWGRAKQPLRDFMFDQIEATGNWSSVYMMLNYRGIDTSEPEKLTTDDVDMISLIPAFMLSELKTSFLIGFKVYLPFLVIDMVIASLLISMGMMMLPPVLISTPFKLLLFVLVDGWTLVVGSLLTSFVTRAPMHVEEVHAGLIMPALEQVRVALGAISTA